MNIQLNYNSDFKKHKIIIIIKIIISAHKFPIKSGWYKKISRKQRKCTICDRNKMGDKIHLLFCCSHAQ